MREMKESGVEWIGKIPNSWASDKVKYHFSNTKRIVGTKVNEYQRLALTLKGVIKRSKDDNEGLQPSEFRGYQILKNGELVFKLIDLQNTATSRVGLSSYTGIVSPAYIVLNGKDSIVPSFAEKYFLSMWHRNIFNHLGDSGVRSNLNAQELLNVSIAYPNITEQYKIADFLDQKCSEIDALTTDIQTQIETLEEYKKSVITEAVTKGLDPNVEMKDSHCFYVGLINKNWDTTKIGYFCKKMYHPVDENLIPLICSNKGKVEIRDNSLVGRMVSENHAMQGIRQGEIAIHGMDTWHGAIGISTFDGNITRVVHVCQSTGDNRFVVYYLQSLAFRNVYKLISNGIRGNTSDFRSWELVKKIVAPHPSKTEQSQIADFLDQKCSEIDQTISEKQLQLETLAEYKKSLIYEYVTGKKEVA